jgi:cytochrome b pre-mRNA-processing protein 3
MPLARLFRPSPRRARAQKLYHALVQASRQPWFYREGGVADSIDGRFDMIVLHAYLILDRLTAAGPEGEATGQAVFDLMFADLDRSLREMGVGDLGVPKRIKLMLQAFYGRAKAYSGEDLEAALMRNLYRSAPPSDEVLRQVAAYVAETRTLLAGLDLLRDEVRFPETPAPSP